MTEGDREVYLDAYTLALKLAKAGALPHWARRIANIFGTRYPSKLLTQLHRSLPRQEPVAIRGQTTKAMTLVEVVSQAAVELGIDGWTECREQGSLSIAATVQRCMVEAGLSDKRLPDPPLVAANDGLLEAEAESTKGSGSGTTLRRRVAAVAAELEIATGWD